MFFLIAKMGVAQYKMDNGNNGGTKNVCSGTFQDKGGTGGNYSNNQSGKITFCPDQPGKLIKLSFTSFETQSTLTGCNDYLDIWNAPSVGAANTQNDRFCGQRGPFTVISTSTDGCLSLQFISDGSTTNSGWSADISCVTPCVNPIAVISDNSTVDLCNSSSLTVSVDGSNSSASGPGSTISKYEWDWGDGTTSSTSSASGNHTYSSPGVYLIRLVVRNNNFGVDPQGCRSTNAATKLIKIAANPDFTGTTGPSVNINCGSSATINGNVKSQSKVQQVPAIISGLVKLPDGTGVSYTSSLDFTGLFASGSKVTSSCYPAVKFSLEHSYSEDLLIELFSPSGKSVKLFENITNEDGVNGLSVFGTCVNDKDDGVPGCTATYTVVNNGGVNWTASGVTTRSNSTCPSYNGSCFTSTFLGDPVVYFKSQSYNSTQPFSVLDGTDLNGIWTLKITDTRIQDDGVLTDWSLVFPTSCYTPAEDITPKINTAVWARTSTSGPVVPAHSSVSLDVSNPGPDACPTCTGNKLSNSIPVGPFLTEGSYIYTLTATDENSCVYSKDVTINVSACPPCPTITNASTAQSLCINGSLSPFSVTTTATDPNSIIFKYFDNPKTGDAVYTDLGGVILKAVTPSSSTATYNPGDLGIVGSLPNVSGNYYVYALLSSLPIESTCRPYQEFKVLVKAKANAPAFDPVPPVCINTTPSPVLPVVSKEGIKGKWSPATVSTQASNTYTFTPDADQCAESTTLVVDIFPNPIVELGAPQINILYGESVTLSGIVSGTNIYEWTPTTDMSGSNTLTPVVNPTKDIVYTLTATNTNGCVAKDSVKIILLTDLIIPNVFSPNGDGVNDKFVIVNLDKYKDASVEIFNRYGQSIVRYYGSNNSWDGKVNGKDAAMGTYFYIINPNAGNQKVISGSISIVR